MSPLYPTLIDLYQAKQTVALLNIAEGYFSPRTLANRKGVWSDLDLLLA